MRFLLSLMSLFLVAGSLVLAPHEGRAQLEGPPPKTNESKAPNPLAKNLANDIHETVVKLSVTVNLFSGKSHTGDMILTHFRPAGEGPFPIVIMNHGRATTPAKRMEPGRYRYTAIVRFWIRRGFAVFVPTRLGYGETGVEIDPEYAGQCTTNRDYRPVVRNMMQQTDATLKFANTMPWVDGKRVIVMGQSYGGFLSIGASGHDLPGLIGAINFAGGGGGDPENRPAQPCGGALLGTLFGEAGKRAMAPMLWLYSENDKYWGADWPRKWHAAYTQAGGKAEFRMFPPVGEDGHKLIDLGFTHWRPVVDQFMSTLGFPLPRSKDSPPPTNFAPLAAADKVPLIKEQSRVEGYAKFLAADVPRAFAIGPAGNWSWRWGDPNASSVALERCKQAAKRACKLYAVDDAVVWPPDP